MRIDLNNLAGSLSGVAAAGSAAAPVGGGISTAGAITGGENSHRLGAGGPGDTDFGEVLGSFINRVDQSQHQADAMVESLALGEPVDVHQVMMALSEASNAMQLTLQVRNKALEAYQELMRTPI